MDDDYNYDYDFGYGGVGDVSTGDTSGYNYDFGYGGTGDVSVGDTGTPGTYSPTTVTSTSGGDNILSRFLSGNATSGDKALATLGFGIASLASALRNKPPAVKMPKYVEAPVYNRALTAPMLPPQPLAQKSTSGQNIYNPMVGLPLFFNPNPFQFNATEAAKRYGPTAQEIAAGQAGYSQGLQRLYESIGTQPAIQFGTTTGAGGTSTVTGGAGNDSVAGGTTTDTTNTTTGATGGSIDDLMMAAGRYLKGPGDGMSDDIHAFIEGGSTGEGQPARLARNEFVIPADVVSDLGNGSSDAGAEMLYEMMERVRKARHGTNKQPPAIKPSKVMPA
jgi:hypothetical protein